MARLARAATFVTVFLLTAGFDQGSKQWARKLPLGEPQPVIEGHWDWQLAMNPGAAFSSFSGATVVLCVIALIALGVITVMAVRLRPEQRLERMALALVAGGALGNLIDRFRYGAVTDFIRWHWGAHAWPIFNVADAALLVGAVLLATASFLAHRSVRPTLSA